MQYQKYKVKVVCSIVEKNVIVWADSEKEAIKLAKTKIAFKYRINFDVLKAWVIR